MRASLAEVCGDASLTFDPESVESIAEAIDQVVRDEQLRRPLRTAGLAQASRFRWDRTAARHVEAYHRVLDEAGDGAPRGSPQRVAR